MNRIASFSLAGLLALASPAFAHARLETAIPTVGGTVASSPVELRLHFSEGVEPHFSGVTLTDASGGAVALGKPAVDPADKSILVMPVAAPLKPGVYTVTWHAVSVDTHKTQGTYSFTVAP